MAPEPSRNPIRSGIRFRLSVMFLTSALGLVVMGTMMLVLAPLALIDLRPTHRGLWEAGRLVESMYRHMLLDAMEAQYGDIPAFPETEMERKREAIAGILGDARPIADVVGAQVEKGVAVLETQ